MKSCHVRSYELFSMKVAVGARRYFYPGLIGLLMGIFFLPTEAQAVIDWHLEWHKGDDHAQLFVFNPESQEQSFVLETGDRVRLDNVEVLDLALDTILLDDIVKSFDLLIGEDVRFKLSPRGRKTRLEVTVYLLDESILGGSTFQSQPQIQGQPQGQPSTRAIVPTPRVPTAPTVPALIYRKVIDHEYDAEQLIRTGQKLGSLYLDVQEVLLFLFQRITTLSPGAQAIWEAAFPELSTAAQPITPPTTTEALLVTFLASNQTFVTREVALNPGDILEPQDPQFPRVVVGEAISFLVPANTPSYTQLVRAYRLTSAGPVPTQNTLYLNVISHDTRLEHAIQIGNEEGFSSSAIQNVVLYITEGAPLAGEGAALWQRIASGQPFPPPSGSRGISACFGPFLSSTTAYSTGANLIFLAGVMVPLRTLVKRRIRK